MVDGNGKCRLVIVRILGHHGRESQFLRDLDAHGRADEALGLTCHEIDVFLGGKFRRTDHIALIFPVRIVGHQDDFSGAEVLQRLLYRIVLIFHIYLPCD